MDKDRNRGGGVGSGGGEGRWLVVAVTCDHPFLLYFLLTLPPSFGPGDADLSLPRGQAYESILLDVVTSPGMGPMTQVTPIRLVSREALCCIGAAKLVGCKPETAGASIG